MTRTKPSQNTQMLSAIVSRSILARSLQGVQYGGDRDIYQVLGYDSDPTFSHFYAQYLRQDIAAAIIDRPVLATWRGPVDLFESDDDEDTPLEKEYKELSKRLKLKSVFSRVDRLTGLGEYSVLFLGFSDVQNRDRLKEEVDASSNLQLLYIRPLSQPNATIATWENDPTNERYGLPNTYTLTIGAPGTDATETLIVHHTRIIHIAENCLEGQLTGIPRLKCVYNRLKDLEKLTGGSAEMFWRGARPGYQGNIDPDVGMDAEEKEKLREQLDEYDHNLRRFLMASGVDIKSLESQVADPSNHVDVQIQMISAATGIPKRILTGSERGELASTEDRDNWLEMIKSRREEFAEPLILYPFVDRLIEYGVLPEAAEKYSIGWRDLWSVSDKDKADLGKARAEAIRGYLASPIALDLFPPQMFYKWVLGMSDEDIEQIEEIIEQAQRDEETEQLLDEELDQPQPPAEEDE